MLNYRRKPFRIIIVKIYQLVESRLSREVGVQDEGSNRVDWILLFYHIYFVKN